jgi:hypothetical protein
LKAASYVFLIFESIPYLLLRYGRLKIHLYPLSSFRGVVQTAVSSSGESFNFIPAMLELFLGSPNNLGFRREE